jgi:hypothetical protein
MWKLDGKIFIRALPIGMPPIGPPCSRATSSIRRAMASWFTHFSIARSAHPGFTKVLFFRPPSLFS